MIVSLATGETAAEKRRAEETETHCWCMEMPSPVVELRSKHSWGLFCSGNVKKTSAVNARIPCGILLQLTPIHSLCQVMDVYMGGRIVY